MKSSSMASSSERKLANVVGGKTARACDICARKRARWYCAADDAFLCQACESSVHSANPLARRHKRVRLKTSSSIPPGFDDETGLNRASVLPSCCWHKGFTKKARTPRRKKHANGLRNHPLRLVPEISSEDYSNQENDNNEQLLYRVPIFDPFLGDFGTSAKQNEHQPLTNKSAICTSTSNDVSQEISNLQHFLPSEMELAEFAADVESLLGTGLEDESFDMEGLGLLDSKECISFGTTENRGEEEEEEEEIGLEVAKSNHQNDLELIDMGRETFELSFDYDCEEEDVKPVQIGEPMTMTMMMNDLGSCNKVDHHESKKKTLLLRLDYQGVLSAWDGQKSPWTTGERPELDDSADCWPSCMGTCGRIHVYGDMGPMMGGHVAVMANGGREARVSRYREKRRTRLFSKKIRYEVRKLNAEKRPRMKGRFVKRANLVATGLPLLKK